MKTNQLLSLFLICFALIQIKAQSTYIPDDAFEKALIDLGYDSGKPDNYVLTSNIVNITDLNIAKAGKGKIKDLTGIEAFTRLVNLNISDLDIKDLDLRNNILLETLNCSKNKLETLNVSSNTELTNLDCSDNDLEILYLGNNTKLEALNCKKNDLVSLDVSNNTALTRIDCSDNTLTSLNIRNGNNTNIVEFKANKNKELGCIDVDNEVYSYNNWSNKDDTAVYSNNCATYGLTYVPDDAFEQALIDLGLDTILDDYVITSAINSITSLDVSSKGIEDLTGIEDFKALTTLDCSFNNLSILDVNDNTAITSLTCNDNNLSVIDVSSNPALRVLLCSFNDLSTLDLRGNTAITTLYCEANNLTTLNIKNGNNGIITTFEVRYNPALSCIEVDDEVYSTTNWLNKDTEASYSTNCHYDETYVPDDAFEQALIDLGLDTVLDDYVITSAINSIISLDVSSKGIEDLTGIEDFKALTILNCFDNRLSTLDVSNNTAITSLSCFINRLSTLDLSANPALTTLYCSGNSLSALDLSANTALTSLYCDTNNLTTLNIKNGNNGIITNFEARDNPALSCIEVDDEAYSTTNWLNKDTEASYSTNCHYDETYVPDDAFEQALIDLGLDTVLDDYVITSAINSITVLDVSSKGIEELTGIEDFKALTTLNCFDNRLSTLDVSNNTAITSLSCFINRLSTLDLSTNTTLRALDCSGNNLSVLDLSANPALTILYCDINNLTTLNVKNGNNGIITAFEVRYNPALSCIEVDDEAYSTANWLNKDAEASYSTNCDISEIARANNTSKNKKETLHIETDIIPEGMYKLYPNPVTNTLKIKTKATIDEVSVLNIQGSVMLTSQKNEIDFSGLPSGIYLVRIASGNQRIYKKIVKE